jgi:hypothetical protein
MKYKFDESTGNIVDTEDGEVIATVLPDDLSVGRMVERKLNAPDKCLACAQQRA